MPARSVELKPICSNCNNDVLPLEQLRGKTCLLDPVPEDDENGVCVGYDQKPSGELIPPESKYKFVE